MHRRVEVKILLAIDDSKYSEAAVRTLLAQARPHGTQIRVLHVLEPASLRVGREIGGYGGALDAIRRAETKRAGALVAKVAERLRSKGLKVTTSVEQGDPKSKIIDAASDWHANLIVVGSHGRKGLDHFLLGSVSEAVARHACCSVEIVRIRSKH